MFQCVPPLVRVRADLQTAGPHQHTPGQDLLVLRSLERFWDFTKTPLSVRNTGQERRHAGRLRAHTHTHTHTHNPVVRVDRARKPHIPTMDTNNENKDCLTSKRCQTSVSETGRMLITSCISGPEDEADMNINTGLNSGQTVSEKCPSTSKRTPVFVRCAYGSVVLRESTSALTTQLSRKHSKIN